jgi:hypothetical protein
MQSTKGETLFHSSKLKSFVISLVALAAFAALVVAPASAENLKATFSGTSMKLTTTGITVEKNGTEAKSCTLNTGATSGPISSNAPFVQNEKAGGFQPVTGFTCTGSTKLQVFTLYSQPYFDTTTSKYILPLEVSTESVTSPWGKYLQNGKALGVWVNGSALTPSTLTYSKTQIGLHSATGQPITISGTFKATTSSGGALTLSH